MVKINQNSEYVPKRGDIVHMNFSPTQGHEQKGFRPGLIVSSFTHNDFAGLALICPITSNIKNFAFEYVLPNGLKTKGAVLVNHLKIFDWEIRKPVYIESISESDLQEIQKMLKYLILE